jgi:hypothetical protein
MSFVLEPADTGWRIVGGHVSSPRSRESSAARNVRRRSLRERCRDDHGASAYFAQAELDRRAK